MLLKKIKGLLLALILFVDASIRSSLNFFFIPQRNDSSTSVSISAISNSNIQQSPFDFGAEQKQKERVENLKQAIQRTVHESQAAWTEQWNDELPLPACLLLAVYHYFVSRKFFLLSLFVPSFFASFAEKATIQFISAFSITLDDDVGQQSLPVTPLSEHSATTNERQEPLPQQRSSIEGVVVRCNKSYGLFLYCGETSTVKNEQDEDEESAQAVDEPAAPRERDATQPPSSPPQSLAASPASPPKTTTANTTNDESEASLSSFPTKGAREKEEIEATEQSQHEEEEQQLGEKRSLTQRTDKSDNDDNNNKNKNGNVITTRKKPRRPSFHAPSHGDRDNVSPDVPSNARLHESPQPAKIDFGEDEHCHNREDDDKNQEPEQQKQQNQQQLPEHTNNTIIYAATPNCHEQLDSFVVGGNENEATTKFSAVSETVEKGIHCHSLEQLDDLHHGDEQPSQPEKQQQQQQQQQQQPTPFVTAAGTATNTTSSCSSSASSSSSFIQQQQNQNQNQNQTKNKNQKPQGRTFEDQLTYIWIDAAATRSAIPQWWTLFWKRQQQQQQQRAERESFSSASSAPRARHCQLVHLTESIDSEDCAHMVSPTTDVLIKNSSPTSDPGSAIAASTNINGGNNNNNNNSGLQFPSVPANKSKNPLRTRLMSGKDFTRVNLDEEANVVADAVEHRNVVVDKHEATKKKIIENTSRVLTEALAEGIVSAWSLVAQGRLDVLDRPRLQQSQHKQKRSPVSVASSSNNISPYNVVVGENETISPQHQQQQQQQQQTSVSSSGWKQEQQEQQQQQNKTIRQRICFVTTGYEAAAALLLAATSTSEEMRNSFAGCIFFDALADFSVSVSKRHVHFPANQASIEAPFSSLCETRSVSLLEEMWRRMMRSTHAPTSSPSTTTSPPESPNVAVVNHPLPPPPAPPPPSIKTSKNALPQLQPTESNPRPSYSNSSRNPLGRIIEGVDLDLRAAANLCATISPGTSPKGKKQAVASVFASRVSNNNNGNDNSRSSGVADREQSGIGSASSSLTSPLSLQAKSALKQRATPVHRPVVFRVPSVPDWSMFLETSSQHSGRNTPSATRSLQHHQQQQQQRRLSATPTDNNNSQKQTDNSSNNNNNNHNTAASSLDADALQLQQQQHQQQANVLSTAEGGETAESSPNCAKRSDNRKPVVVASTRTTKTTKKVPKLASDIFAAPSIALKVDENSLIEAASGSQRPRTFNQVSSLGTLSDNTFAFSASPNQLYDHRGDTMNPESFAAFLNTNRDLQLPPSNGSESALAHGTSMRSDSANAFQVYQINEIADEDANISNNNSSNNVFIQRQQRRRSPSFSSAMDQGEQQQQQKQRLSELAHKTDQFFRNDMRSVAARVQLNHGTFVFVNNAKQNRQSSKNTPKKKQSNERQLHHGTNDHMSPGTKLIQTWIRRVENPQEFENLSLSASSFSSPASAMSSNSNSNSKVTDNRSNFFFRKNSSSMASFVKSCNTSFVGDEGGLADNENNDNDDDNDNDVDEYDEDKATKSMLMSGQNVLFVKLPSITSSSSFCSSSCAAAASASIPTTTSPCSSDVVLFVFLVWNYFTHTIGLFRFVDSCYRRLSDFFWISFVLNFLGNGVHGDEVHDVGAQSREMRHQQEQQPAILNLVETIGNNLF